MECYKDYYLHNFKFKPCSELSEEIFAKGTSVYEVIRLEQGIPLFLEDHLNRLFYSADLSNFAINESYCDIETLIEELVKKNNVQVGKIKLVIRFENGHNEKDLILYFTPHYFPTTDEYQNGVEIGICKAVRSNPNAKILNTDARKTANNRIAEERLFEVLLINQEGFITEGSRSNVFFVKESVIYTPVEKDVLNGITRRNILKLCKKNNIPVIEKDIHYSDLQYMDALFITGTSLKVLPVNKLDDQSFDTKNQLITRLQEIYNKAIEEYILAKNLT